MATTARACARSQAADTAAPLPVLPGSSCCLADAAAPLTAPLAAAGGPMLGTFGGRLLRDAITLVALPRACAHERVAVRVTVLFQSPCCTRDSATMSMATNPCALSMNSHSACNADSG